jgi:hypothetical protein
MLERIIDWIDGEFLPMGISLNWFAYMKGENKILVTPFGFFAAVQVGVLIRWSRRRAGSGGLQRERHKAARRRTASNRPSRLHSTSQRVGCRGCPAWRAAAPDGCYHNTFRGFAQNSHSGCCWPPASAIDVSGRSRASQEKSVQYCICLISRVNWTMIIQFVDHVSDICPSSVPHTLEHGDRKVELESLRQLFRAGVIQW